MAKIRALKPETWTDGKFLRLTPLARLLFLGMWNLACDNGHLDDDPVELKIRLLPMDQADIEALVEEMVATGQVERRGGFLKVANLARHQRIDLRFLALCDHCEHDEHTTFKESDRKNRTQSARRVHSERTTGTRGAHVVDGDGDGDGDGDKPATQAYAVAEPSSPQPEKSNPNAVLLALGLSEDERREFNAHLREAGARSPSAVVLSLDSSGQLADRVREWRDAKAAAEKPRPGTAFWGKHVGKGAGA